MKALESHMQLALHRLEKWANINEFTVNTQKPDLELFTLSTKHHEIVLRFRDETIP